MKKKLRYLKVFFPVLIILAALNGYAQEYTLTTTNANIVSSRALLDLPGLSGNSLAIIVATPLGNTKTLNPHPTGAWYYSGKWNLFNSDHAVMLPGLTYKIQYFPGSGINQFVHLVTQQNLGSDGSYIDNPALNNNPNVQFAIFQNHSPDVRPGSRLNQFEAKAGYSAAAGKWYITNVAGQPLLKGCAYNIVISTGETTVSTTSPLPIDGSPVQPCKCPVSLPPSGVAGGDLSGSYPEPMVRKILGREITSTPPNVGQVLKWNGTAWQPADDHVAATTSTPAAPAATPEAIPLQTFFKNANDQSPPLGMNGTYIFKNHSHSITVTKNSRLIISGSFYMRSAAGLLDLGSTKMTINLLVNNVYKATLSSEEIANKANLTSSISNYMFDVGPGTHLIQFQVSHPWIDGNVAGIADAMFSSIIVLPL